MDADAMASITRERASSRFAIASSTNSVAQPRLHTTQQVLQRLTTCLTYESHLEYFKYCIIIPQDPAIVMSSHIILQSSFQYFPC